MQFISTRSGMEPASFTDILLDGLAPDGGLVVPASIPQVSAAQLEAWRTLSYPELAAAIIGLYATDIPTADLARLTAAAYSSQNFPGGVPLRRVDNTLVLVGLSEGPTMAFKDLAMQFLGQAIPYVLAATGRDLTILGATSGDTGSSAEYAFRGQPGVRVVMLSPRGRMSAVQRAQMYSLQDANIHNLVVDGVFDDCQDIVKTLSSDIDFKTRYRIGAVNSINFGRIAAQIVYYFWAWLRYTDGTFSQALNDDAAAAAASAPASGGAGGAGAGAGGAGAGAGDAGADATQVDFCVPSGNFGNIYAGHLARCMGLPIRRLLLATNENNVLEEFFTTGRYTPRSREHTFATSSPSMDISKASNVERFIWQVLGEDFPAAWEQLGATGTLDMRDYLPEFGETFGFAASSSHHADRLAAIEWTYQTSGILIDPHTADAVTVARRLSDGAVPVLAMETARPEKFAHTVREAVGDVADGLEERLAGLLALPQRATQVPADPEAVREYIATHCA
ncbi:threonine synthase [Actinotignum sp. GS-2025a]|uniref:threonine synthase n=1 Tax=Actinotignum sp. GS-2025a TaxID=3427274 RepID=UPI003F4669CA